MNNKELSMVFADLLSEKKAVDIKVIDIAEKSSFADFFVNASAGSARHLDSLARDVEDKFAELGIETKSIDGKPESGWILIDGGDVIVNIFTIETRDKYTLDKFWSDCETIVIENR